MKQIFWSILLLLTSAQVFSQSLNLYKKSVYDHHSKQILPYATIHISNSLKYSDADEKGYFELYANNSDTLFISSIGYKTYKALFSDINSDSIFLISLPITMENVVVGKPERKTFGLFGEKINRSCIDISVESRQELATLIEIPNSIKMYRPTKILIKATRFQVENPLRLHIYSVGNDGLPDKELMVKERIITKNDFVGKAIIIDVKDQGIVLENVSFFVSIQWLTSATLKWYTGPEIFETFKIKKLLTYRRQLNMNNNKWFGHFKKNIIFYPGGITPLDDTPINVMASAEIEIL